MNPQDILTELEAIRAETLRRLENLSQHQLDAHPPKTENDRPWSLGEVFMHLAIDEAYLRELIARPLREGTKPPEGITFLPPPPPYGTPKEVIEFWFARSRARTNAFVEDWPAEWYPDLKHEGGLELMNALEWLKGYGSHEAFHHRQLDTLIALCHETGVT